MKKIIYITIFINLLYITSIAQVTEKEEDLKKVSKDSTDGWKKGGVFSLTFGQTTFSEYWAAGGVNSISLNGIAGLHADYKKGKFTWENNLDLGYGTQGLKNDSAFKFQKTDDKIDFASKFGYKAAKSFYYAAVINFKTQMTDGKDFANNSDSIISKLMSPAYLLAAAGIDYKPNKFFSAFIAPLTSKTTFVLYNTLAAAGAYGVEPGKNIRNEFGGYIKTVFTKDIMKNINLTTKLDLFSNYLHNPQNIDINWDMLIAMKVNKFISANISTQLIYDDDIKFDVPNAGNTGTHPAPRTQFKEVFGVGFSFQF